MGFWSSIGSAIGGISSFSTVTNEPKEAKVAFDQYDQYQKEIQNFDLEPQQTHQSQVIDMPVVQLSNQQEKNTQ